MNRTIHFLINVLIGIMLVTGTAFATVDTVDITPEIAVNPSLMSFRSAVPHSPNSSLAQILATNKGTNNIQFRNPYNSSQIFLTWAGDFTGKVDGNNANFYCVDIQKHLAFYKDNDPHTYKDSITTSSQITYVLMNFYPYKPYPYAGALDNITKEAAAIQLAIWSFADGVNLTTVSVKNNATLGTEIKNRAIQIRDEAIANAGALTPIKTLIINPGDQSLFYGQTASFTVKVYNELAQPAANVTVTLNSSDGVLNNTTALTNVNGETSVIILSKGVSDTAVITASAQVIIPQGTRYFHSNKPNDYQKIVLASPVVANRSTNAKIVWTGSADLRLSKTASDLTPDNGQTISYTVTLNNDGPTFSSGVKVADVLPAGLQLISTTPSQGSYDTLTGVWNVGTVASGGNATLVFSVKVDITIQKAFDFGAATPFNLFVFEDLYQPSSDTEGKIAVGRDVYLSNYSVGYKLPNSNGTEDVLVVGRHLVFVSGDIFGGNAVYENSETVSPQVGLVNGTLRKDTVVDFAAARTHLTTLSTQLSGRSVNGVTTKSGVTIRLDGTDPFINVFAVSDTQLNSAQEVFINAPNGSVVLVNFSGKKLAWQGNLVINGTSMTNTLFNFYEADSLQISQIDVRGTVLAPLAAVNFVSGVQHGQMIAKSLKGTGQFNLAPFIGNLAIDTTLVNVAEVIASNIKDPNSTPNFGGAAENDYASVSIHIKNTGLGAGTGGNSLGNWQSLGVVTGDEYFWTMAYDKDNSLLAGTWGGKVLRSTDGGTSFTRINPDMQVGYVWSIKVNAQGDIYVATERGVFKSTNNGASFTATSLPTMDVRALTIDANGVVYAGIWGGGVHKSTDGGANWVAVNSGLGNTVVHGLVIAANGSLVAGTYGGGIYTSSDAGASWVKSQMTYDYVWSLGRSANGLLVAGTYGNGVFTSVDNGLTWGRENLSESHIYSIAVDTSDNIYVSSWYGGVFLGTLNSTLAPASGRKWASIGLAGAKVSTIAINPITGSLFAATGNGTLLKNDTPTSIEKLSGVTPKEFVLENNYPNPFNPSTTIKFSVAQESKVTLTVYTVLGEQVATLVNSELVAGSYSVSFDASQLPSGVYLYRLTAGDHMSVKKMLLAK